MATIQYVVNAVDAASATFERIAGSADHLLKELDDIGKKSVAARVALNGDKEMGLTLDKLDLKMANLGKKVAMGKVGVEGQARAILQIRALEASLDKLDGRHATATVEVNTRGGLLGRLGSLFGGGGASGGRAAGGAGSALGGLGNAIPVTGQAIGIGAAAALGAAVAPAAIPTALGLGAGGLGLLLTQAKGLKTVMADVVTTLKTAAAPLKGAFGDILKDFDHFIKSQGPGLRDMFKASLPFLNVFIKALEQLGKTLLPVITASLRQMTPYLPLISQGLLVVIQGLAGMIQAIGPRGMKASAMLFVDLCRIMGEALILLGQFVNGLAVGVQYTVHAIHQEWDDLRHLTADAFDQIRHYVAASWDATWQDTVGKTIRGVRTVVAGFRSFISLVGGVLTNLKAVIAGAWNTIWANTITKVQNGIATVVTRLGTLPGKIKSIFHGALTWLDQAGRQVVQGLWNGLLFVWHKVQSFISGIASWIKAHKGPISLDSRLLEPAGRALMTGLHLGLKLGSKGPLGFITGLTGTIGSLLSGGVHALFGGGGGGFGDTGARSGNAAIAQSFARSILPRGWSWPALLSLWNQESGWNAYAVNPSSGAYGIPQSLGHGHPYNLGDYKAQIEWGINYIATRPGYGTSQAAWAHEQAFNWYDRGGWLPPGASLAYNATGHPEQVVGPASMTQVVALLAQILRAVQIAPSATSAGTARALNSAARAAVR